MPAVVFLSHIPTLRIAEDAPFAGGELTRLPWDQYDMLSQGAFSDFRQLYEGTAPVFYRVDAPELEAPPVTNAPAEGGMCEVSAPSGLWEELLPGIGLGLMLAFSRSAVDTAWTALLLAAPAAAPPWPRLSVTFAARGDESTAFALQGRNYDGIRVDGDAGQQFLFSPVASGMPIDRATIERADALLGVVESTTKHRALAAAISALRALTHPSLSPSEQTTLAVVALEALLLPEVTTGLGRTFARRVATLLAPEGEERSSLEHAARALYDARSASLHGGSSGADTTPGSAQRLLAAAIAALAAAAGEEGDVSEICAALDDGRRPDAAQVSDDGVGRQAPRRLQARRPRAAAGFTIGAGPSIAAEEGKLLSFSPLVGLTCAGSLDFGDGSGVVLTAAPPATILTIEDKDTRRELMNLAMMETPVAALAVTRDAATGEVDEMLRVRDLTVVALRLAGLGAFVDPELCGSYVYEGVTRTVDSTVFAPAILRGMGADPDESFADDDVKRFWPGWILVSRYEAEARHPEIDAVLTLYRRAHDTRFLPPDGRAGLLVGLVEAMLGRFRRPDDPVQLEDLVRAVGGEAEPAAADWFASKPPGERGSHARRLRNSIAHGYWDGDPEPLASIQSLLRPIVRGFVTAWLETDDRTRRPGTVFIDRVSAGVRSA
jgi:hypothetical protein